MIFATLCLVKALSLSYRLSFFTPKLVEVNLCEADVAELAVVWEKKALMLASRLLMTAGTPGHI